MQPPPGTKRLLVPCLKAAAVSRFFKMVTNSPCQQARCLQGEVPTVRHSMKRIPSHGDAPAPWSDNAAGASQRNMPIETSSELEPATVVPAALVPEVERMLHVRLEQEIKKKVTSAMHTQTSGPCYCCSCCSST